MKPLLVITAAALLFTVATPAFAQLTLNLNVSPHPDPVIAHWQHHPEYAMLTVINGAATPVNAKLTVRILLNNVLQAETKFAQMPVQQFLPGASTFQTDQLLPMSAITFYGGVQNTVTSTGMLPAGSYQLCAGLVDPTSGAQLTPLQCRPFTITAYTPPTLIQPANGTVFPTQTINTVFRWTPINPLPPSPVNYHIRVIEILPGQTSIIALQNNVPFLDRVISSITQMIWPADVVISHTPIQCVWTVQAEDETGAAIAAAAAPFVFACDNGGTTPKADSANGTDTTHVTNGPGLTATTDTLPRTQERVQPDSGHPMTTTRNPPDTTHQPPPDSTIDCLCTVNFEWLAGPAITIDEPLAAHPAANLGQGMGVGLSCFASDKDILVHKCMLGGVKEEFIRDVGDPVAYNWSVVKGDADKLIGGNGNSVIYALPDNLKKGEKYVATVAVKITSEHGDDPVDGSVTITAIGGDTCEPYSITTVIDSLKEKDPHERPPITSGTCSPAGHKWKKAGGIAATLIVPANIPNGQMVLLECPGTDPDVVTLLCTSDKCGNPDKDVKENEPLLFTWDDGGAGGSFVLSTGGPSVLYVAPDDPSKKSITFTVNIKDNNTHGDASGEKTDKTNTADTFDAMTEMNLTQDEPHRKFFTVGVDGTLAPTLSKKPPIVVNKITWCLDLGGATGDVKAMSANAKGLSTDSTKLYFSKEKYSDNGLKKYWKNHTHIHDKHPLQCRITYQMPGIAMSYQDNTWANSDFLEKPDLKQFKLFFDHVYTGMPPKKDDGKWRDDKARKDDKFVPDKAPQVNGNDASNWFVHWAQNTYDPCTHPYDLKDDDPKLYYYDKVDGMMYDESGTLKKASVIADYHNNDENIVRISKQAGEKIELGPFVNPGKIITSDMRTTAVPISLPHYKLEGVEMMNKVVNHELAHWEAIKHNWDAGGPWRAAYGAYSTKPVKVKTIVAKKSPEVKVVATPNKRDDDAKVKYSVDITIDTTHITISHGWLENGSFDQNFELWSEHDAATIPGYASLNGVIISRKGLEFTISERPNDPDEDWVPNQMEDQIGTNWHERITYKGFYHPNKNDQEFWAEWRTQAEATPTCTKEKDWANPGLQTK